MFAPSFDALLNKHCFLPKQKQDQILHVCFYNYIKELSIPVKTLFSGKLLFNKVHLCHRNACN